MLLFLAWRSQVPKRHGTVNKRLAEVAESLGQRIL